MRLALLCDFILLELPCDINIDINSKSKISISISIKVDSACCPHRMEET